ncbi:uncharacterized protein LOC131841624 [Achroia grisella]|uniref:uncharacterized protein LOC131841624 n=1 Tax=Achroia grisella TaxID=688607 RepID=UPI0027D27F95|nr:uncharacterized protein LOC131841624 [Achroia grisella]
MSDTHLTSSLRLRVARESQLLAEKKWILTALKKIKTQRNSLQIERLHLESMKVSLKQELQTENKKDRFTDTSPLRNEECSALMEKNPQISSTQITEYDPTVNMEDLEALCNEEELNLGVQDTIAHKNNSDFCMEEDDEDNDDNCDDDILIDMNMFMNGQM